MTEKYSAKLAVEAMQERLILGNVCVMNFHQSLYVFFNPDGQEQDNGITEYGLNRVSITTQSYILIVSYLFHTTDFHIP